jgi:hypothetical protein
LLNKHQIEIYTIRGRLTSLEDRLRSGQDVGDGDLTGFCFAAHERNLLAGTGNIVYQIISRNFQESWKRHTFIMHYDSEAIQEIKP